MSFIGTPILQQVSPNLLRITGISLASEAFGTIGLHGATGTAPDITLPDTFVVPAVTFEGSAVPLQAAIRVDLEPVSTGPLTNLPPSITKTGTTKEDFRITVTNTNTSLTTQSLELYIEAQAKVAKSGVTIGPVITVVGDGVVVE